MKKIKLLTFIIICIIAITLAACTSGDDVKNKEPTGETAAVNGQSEESGGDSAAETQVSRENTPDTLPDDLDFKGTVINVYHRGDGRTVQFDTVGTEELIGDIVLDAVYNRNLRTEERLNVKFNWIAGAEGNYDFPEQVRKVVLAGTGDHDLVIMENSFTFMLSLQGLFQNIVDAPYIDFSQPWWYTEMMAESSIDNNKRYFIIGDMTVSTLMRASALLFNKKIFRDNFGDEKQLYDHVLNKTWTHPVFAEYCKNIYRDLNGNGVADDGDLFGIEYNEWTSTNFTMASSGLKFSGRDKDGLPTIDIYNENSILFAEALYDLFYESMSFRSVTMNPGIAFLDSRNLFYTGTLEEAASFRIATFDYGILPYPVLFEGLDYISGAATSNANGASIPITAPSEKFEAVCAAMESLSAEAYRRVVPVWYDVALKIKHADQDIDAQMVDIIYSTINAPFIYMASRAYPDFGNILTASIYNAKGNRSAFVATWDKKQNSVQSQWDKMIQKYLELE